MKISPLRLLRATLAVIIILAATSTFLTYLEVTAEDFIELIWIKNFISFSLGILGGGIAELITSPKAASKSQDRV